MRYNPATDNARTIDQIAAECKAAITAPVATEAPGRIDCDLLNAYTKGLSSYHPRHFYAHLEAVVAMNVAEAMGNFSEYRRLRAAVIDGLY